MSETLYKVLDADGSSLHGGSGVWSLPNGKPGKWMPKIENISPCRRGYHVLKPEMLIQWLGPAIFEVEVRGKQIWQDDKGVVEQARLLRRLDRWNDQTARLLACDYAESVVHLAKDERSVNAIRIARRFALGLAADKERAAARAAAWAAARDAAWAAAWAAARAAAWAAARAAAWAAARAAWAGRDAAWAAARDAAWDAQTKRLFEYLNDEVDLAAIKRSVA